MQNPICPGCERELPEKYASLLRSLKTTIREFYADKFKDADDSIEVIVRIDGDVVGLISQEMFDTVGFSGPKS